MMEDRNIDWKRVRELQHEMESLGVYPVLSLTASDVRHVVQRDISDEDAAIVLDNIRSKEGIPWSEWVEIWAEDVPGTPWEEDG